MPEGGDVKAHDTFMVPMCWTWLSQFKLGIYQNQTILCSLFLSKFKYIQNILSTNIKVFLRHPSFTHYFLS